MSDFRKFCWGTFLGIGGTATAFNHGVLQQASKTDGSLGILILGLMFGCLSVMFFGAREAKW